MAGPVTSEERSLVAQLRERFRDELALREREGRLHPCFFGETALCRVLRGNQGELERSVAWFDRFLEKTIDYGIDDIAMSLTSKLNVGAKADATILPNFEEVREHCRFVFKAPKSSSDGDLVQYIPVIDLDKYGILEELDWDFWVRFTRSAVVLLCLQLEQMSCVQRRMVKCVVIVDLAGCSLDQILCSTFDNANDRDVSKALEHIASEVISEVYVVNAPGTVTTLFTTFKAFIPSKFTAKFHFPPGDGSDDASFVERAGGKEQLQYLYSTRVGLVSRANRTITLPHEQDGMPTEKEKQQIAKIRERFEEAFSARQTAGLLHPCFFGSLAIARVLRGNDGSLSMAIKWFERFLEKANQYGIDRHYEYVVKKLDASGSQYGNLTMLPYYDEVKDYFRMVFTAPRPTPKGDIVQYIALADVDREGILENVDWSHWVAFMRSFMILRCIEAERLSRMRKRMVRCISVVDLEDSGVGLKGLPSMADFDEPQGRDVFEFMQNSCAEILGTNYIVNAPWVMVKAYNWFRNCVPDRLSRKLRLLDGNGRSDAEFVQAVGGEAQLDQLLATRVGLTRGQKDEPSGVKEIPPGQDFQKVREVCAGQRVSWSCEVLPSFADGLLGASSVEFGVTAHWIGEDIGDGSHPARRQVEEIIPQQAVDSRRGRISGSCRSMGSGVITLKWSNSGSMLHSKAIRYSVAVTDSNTCDNLVDVPRAMSSSAPPPGRGDQPELGPSFQYYRFTPTKIRCFSKRSLLDATGVSRHGNYCHLCALHFRSCGTPLNMTLATVTNPGGRSLPGDGPEELVDGKLSTKWADIHRGALVLKFPSAVHVDEVGFTTAGDMPDCDPVRWMLEGSWNGQSWILLHSQAVDFPMPMERLTTSLWLHLASADLGEAHWQRPPETSFQAFRFTPRRLRSDEADAVQASAIKFRTAAGYIIGMEDATVSNPGGLCDKGHGPKRIIDGSAQTCWADRNKMSILVQFPQYMRLEEFCFTTARDRPECDPIHWILEGTRVGGTWTLLVSSTDEYSVPTRRSSSTVWFSIAPPGEGGEVSFSSPGGSSSSSSSSNRKGDQFCPETLCCSGRMFAVPVETASSYSIIAREVCERDREKVLEAVSQDGSALKFAAAEVCGDREVVVLAVNQCGRALLFASRELRADREIVLAAVAQDGRALEYASSELRSDWVVVQTAVSQNGWALRYAAEELRADYEVVQTALAGNPAALRFAAASLRADRELIKAAVARNGWLLRLAAPELRADREVVLAAVANTGVALGYASEELRADREVVKAALAQDPMALECADEALCGDRELVTAAVLRDGSVLELASDELREDPELVLAAGDEDGATFPYLPPEKRVGLSVHHVARPCIGRVRLPRSERSVPQVQRESPEQLFFGFPDQWSV